MSLFRIYLQVGIVCIWGIVSLMPACHPTKLQQVPGCRAHLKITGNIKGRFPCIYTLLNDMVILKKDTILFDVFNIFCESGKNSLFFMDKKLPTDIVAATGNGYLSPDSGNFSDTIFLNTDFLSSASKEYLISAIFHEYLHAFMHWCSLSYEAKLNGVTSEFLSEHFGIHGEWLTHQKPYINSDSQHILMSEHYIEKLAAANYPFTNPTLSGSLRHTLATSLAWEGLSETPSWKKLKDDTCYIHNVNGWAGHITTSSRKKYNNGKCAATTKDFLYPLKLRHPCQ